MRRRRERTPAPALYRFYSSSCKPSRYSLAYARNARFPDAAGVAAGAAIGGADVEIDLATVSRVGVEITPAAIARQTATRSRAGRSSVGPRRARIATGAAIGGADVEIDLATISRVGVAISPAGTAR